MATEIQNQNSINVTQERLDEMKATKLANQKILDDINAKGAALTKAKSEFEAYKNSETIKINDARNLLARESENHAKLDTVAMQKTIDDLNNQIVALKSEVDDMNKKNQSLTQEIIALKNQG